MKRGEPGGLRAMWRRVLPYAVQRRGGHRVSVGNRGERLACKALRKSGLKVVGRNVALGFGEIDVVALTREGTVVVVEVKTVSRRQGVAVDSRWAPERQVDAAKRKQLRRLASALCTRKGWAGRAVRFDVVAVELFDDGRHALRHHVDAF